MVTHNPFQAEGLDEEVALRMILEGTATETGEHFFTALVENLSRADLPPIVVPLPMRVLEPWPEGEAERSPEAMARTFQVPEDDSPRHCAA